ncbi:MAG: carboxylating nicotinate-nucleotide diphosphorylase [Planctomycetota bacterium]|jgi:nicotinate-nucleotide pyrophosphorylase (carboxylating)
MQRGAECQERVARIVALALEEDHAVADATSSAVVPDGALAKAVIVARAHGVLAGCGYAEAALRQCDPEMELLWSRSDGQEVAPGDRVLECQGSARGILAAERTALNFLQQLSGVATQTRSAVDQAGSVRVLDTRKTVPLLRDAQKEAVLLGGGENHRRDLEDQLLLKENHFALSGLGYAETVAAAIAASEGRKVGVEAETLEQALAALEAGAAYVLLDNFKGEALREVVACLRERFPHAELEASGGYQVSELAGLGEMGVDRVSMGGLTHSVLALDLSMLLEAVSSA